MTDTLLNVLIYWKIDSGPLTFGQHPRQDYPPIT